MSEDLENGVHKINYDNKSKRDVDEEDRGEDPKIVNAPQMPIALDDVLINELGQLGWFQVRNVLLVALPFMVCGLQHEYIFSAAAIPHRCQIPECGEHGKLQNFDPEWLKNAVPATASGFASCERYAPVGFNTNGTLKYCPDILFNKSETIPCDGFVYAKDNTVVFEFDLGCEEWLRALSGTMHGVGTLVALPIVGYISDRFGRKAALMLSIFNTGLFGLLRAFSINYTMYLALQAIQPILGSGIYSSAYIFVTELVGPDYRVLVGAFAISMFSIGEVFLGSVAWLVPSWRYMTMVAQIPCLVIIASSWLLTESVRWLLSKQKYAKAKTILETVARVNKTQISEKSLEALMKPPRTSTSTRKSDNTDKKNANHSEFGNPELCRSIIRSPVLLRRVCTTPFWWLTTTLIFYGLSINSTSLSDTMHLNYILTSVMEMPGYFMAAFVLNRYGRKATLSSGYFFSAMCNIIFAFVPREYSISRLIIYLLGKSGISMVASSVYLYTSELYPTEFRHTLLAFSSTIGRIGAIVAPLTPVLMIYWHGIPSLLFGGLGIIAGLLVLSQPETLGCRLPDTLAEAEAIGKPASKIIPN